MYSDSTNPDGWHLWQILLVSDPKPFACGSYPSGNHHHIERKHTPCKDTATLGKQELCAKPNQRDGRTVAFRHHRLHKLDWHLRTLPHHKMTLNRGKRREPMTICATAAPRLPQPAASEFAVPATSAVNREDIQN